MSKKSAPTATVDAPTFFSDPYYQKSQDMLFPIAEGLSRGDFMSGGGQLGFLNPLVSLNPDATKASVGLATRDIDAMQRRSFQEIISQLEANNQLESSVTGNRLADLSSDYSRNISDITTSSYLNDVNRIYQNIPELFKMGLGLGSDVRGGALANQGQKNEFNLQNFQNQVTSQMLAKPVASQGGAMGALTGAIGGGLTGFMVGGPWGAAAGAGIGGLAGGFGSPQTGGQILGMGGMSAGLGRSGSLNTPSMPSFMPGSSASSNPFGRLNSQSVGLSSGDALLDKFGYGLGGF